MTSVPAPESRRGTEPEPAVLCVEPDPIIGEFVRRAVSAMGCRVTLVLSPDGALRELTTRKVALAVVDDDLGAARGLNLVGQVRTDYPDLESVLMTTDQATISIVQRLRVERVHCLARPFGLDELRRVVGKALGRPEALPASQVPEVRGLPSGLRVLVVDDDPVVRRSMARTFRQHQVTLAENGRAATAQIERQQPDLIVSDLRMPEMDGIAFAREVGERWPELKDRIVFVSGADSQIERARREVPEQPLVRKTASGNELERRMAEVLEAATRRAR